jgi:hypothetical protein
VIVPFAVALSLLAPSDTVIARGAPLPNTPAITADRVMAEPERYAGDTIVVTGRVERVCAEMGCWLQLAGSEGKPGMRIGTMASNFFVPFSAAGMDARAVGVVEVQTLSKDEADHQTAEGVAMTRNADGGATVVGLKAFGVELRPGT